MEQSDTRLVAVCTHILNVGIKEGEMRYEVPTTTGQTAYLCEICHKSYATNGKQPIDLKYAYNTKIPI